MPAGASDIQDFLVVCPGAATFAQALDWTAEVYRAAGALLAERGHAQGRGRRGRLLARFRVQRGGARRAGAAIERAGFRPGEQVAIALDVAASQFGRDGRYRLGRDGRELDTGGMIELLLGWLARYPILSIEDPLAEDDPQGFVAFTPGRRRRCLVVGDDFLVSDAGRVRAAGCAERRVPPCCSSPTSAAR